MEKSKLPIANIGDKKKLPTHVTQAENASFEQQLTQLREDNEQLKYELMRKTEIFEANEKSSADEIEYWKGEHDKIKKQLQSQSNQFEEERIRMQNIHAEDTSALSEEAHKWELEHEKLLKKLNDIQNKSIAENTDSEVIQQLDVEISELRAKLTHFHLELINSEKKCNKLEDSNLALIQENEEYKESLNSKREELKKSNELNMELQDENSVLKRDLGELQTQPRDINTKGNSLFAEVYDSRNQIKEKFLDLAERYQRVNKEKESLSNEIDILRKETANLREIFNKDMKNYRPGNMFESSGDSASMSAMKTLVESYKQELEKIKQEEPPAERDFQYYEAVIERQKRELENLRGILGDHTLTHSMRARKMSELGVNVAFWKSKASENESEKRFLKLKVQELENKLLDLNSQNGTENSEKNAEKKKIISNKSNSEKNKPKTPVKCLKSEMPKQKRLCEHHGSQKITIISKEEMKALMENKPYPAKESEITSGSNKENENIKSEVAEDNENQEKTLKESTDTNELITESSNKSESSNLGNEGKKMKKIQFADNTKKEDGEGHRPRGRNRYVFNFQVKKID